MGVHSARTPATRRFGLSDAMILIAALAVSLGILRVDGFIADTLKDIQRVLTKAEWSWMVFRWLIHRMLELITLPLLAVTLAVLSFRLRKFRPRWSRLVCQPGLVAGLTMIPAWAFVAYQTYGEVSQILARACTFGEPRGREPLGIWFMYLARNSAPTVGSAVAVAWATMVLVGRWRPEPSWIDRLGRVIGTAWIVIAVFEVVVRTLGFS